MSGTYRVTMFENVNIIKLYLSSLFLLCLQDNCILIFSEDIHNSFSFYELCFRWSMFDIILFIFIKI